MDWFESYRFRLVVTSEHDDMVSYSAHADEGTGEYYSAEVASNRQFHDEDGDSR
jgi:hypothetical protein